MTFKVQISKHSLHSEVTWIFVKAIHTHWHKMHCIRTAMFHKSYPNRSIFTFLVPFLPGSAVEKHTQHSYIRRQTRWTCSINVTLGRAVITQNKSVLELSSNVEWIQKVLHAAVSACIHSLEQTGSMNSMSDWDCSVMLWPLNSSNHR